MSIHSNGRGVQTGTACERLRRLTDDGAGGTQNQVRDFALAAGVAEALFENAVFGVGAMRQSGDWRSQGTPPSAYEVALFEGFVPYGILPMAGVGGLLEDGRGASDWDFPGGWVHEESRS